MPQDILLFVSEHPFLASLATTLVVLVGISAVAVAARQLTPPPENLPFDEEEAFDSIHLRGELEARHIANHSPVPSLHLSIPTITSENDRLDPIALHRLLHSEMSPVAVLHATIFDAAHRRPDNDVLAVGTDKEVAG